MAPAPRRLFGQREPRWSAKHWKRLWLYASAALGAERLLSASSVAGPSTGASATAGAGPTPVAALGQPVVAFAEALLEGWQQAFKRGIRRDPITDKVAVAVACRAAENLILCTFVIVCAVEWREGRRRLIREATEVLANLKVDPRAGAWKGLQRQDSALSQVSQGCEELQQHYSMLGQEFMPPTQDSDAHSEVGVGGTTEGAEIAEAGGQSARGNEVRTLFQQLAAKPVPVRASPARSSSSRSRMQIADQASIARMTATLREGIKAVLEVDAPRKWDSCAVPAFAQLRRAALHASKCHEAFEREALHAPAVLGFISQFVDRYPIRVKQACEVISILGKHPGWAAMLPSAELCTRGRAHAELHTAARRASKQVRGSPAAWSGGMAGASAAAAPAARSTEVSPQLERSSSGQSFAEALRTPRRGCGDADRYFIGDRPLELDRIGSISSSEADDHEYQRPSVLTRTSTAAELPQEEDKWAVTPSIAMIVLLHIIYPSYPVSPQVVLGRIATFIGLLWCLGPAQCADLVKMEPIRIHRMVVLVVLCAFVQVVLWSVSDTLASLVFPRADRCEMSAKVPRHIGQLLQYLARRLPPSGAPFGNWATWCVVCASAGASAIWEEFLFRGIYLSSLRTRLRFWPANAAVALAYALEHEPMEVSVEGMIGVRVAPLLPLLAGSFWCGYVYDRSGSLTVTILANIMVNAGLIWFYITMRDGWQA